MNTSDRARAGSLLAALGIAPASIAQRRLPAIGEARRLVAADLGPDGRDKMLTPAAASAWIALRDGARRDGIALQLVSGFRSYAFQARLIRIKLDRGLPIDEVLRINAPPGYSEHHSGRALDIGTPGCAQLDEAFEHTPAFDWLRREAGRFGFRLSYPRGNRQGYLYEPWHWYYRGRRR